MDLIVSVHEFSYLFCYCAPSNHHQNQGQNSFSIVAEIVFYHNIYYAYNVCYWHVGQPCISGQVPKIEE